MPRPVRDYLAASERKDFDAAVAPFADHATVTDEGRTHTGIDAVRAWRHGAANEYTYTTEITGIRRDGDDTWVVVTHLAGDFPGGEADVEQRFTVAGDAITGLFIG